MHIEFFTDMKTFVEIGNVSIAWYAVLILLGALIAYCISKYNTRKAGYPDYIIEDLFIYILWVGIIGARLWFCLFYDFEYYFTRPLELISIWDGGLAIQGGVVAAIIFGYFYAKKHGISLLRFADQVMPTVLIAQAVGRWGNFMNQEAHGARVDASYFDGVLSFLKEGMYINGAYYEPMFFYESLLCILGFIIIYFLVRHFQNKRGDLFWSYFMWYGLIRFFIEGHRTDALMIGPLRMAQLTSVIFFLIGLLGYIGLFEKFFAKPKPTILFDLDGTLLDTEKGIIESFGYVFQKHGIEFTDEMKVEVLGPSLKESFTKYASGLDYEELIKEYRTHNAEIFSKVNKPMHNAKALLEYLKENDYQVGVVSTKYQDTCLTNLKAFDLDGLVDGIVGGNEVLKQKPNPEGIFKIIKDKGFYRDELIYVGDSYNDIIAGKNAGAYTIAYYFNSAKKAKIEKANADKYIDDLYEIVDILSQDIHFTNDGK